MRRILSGVQPTGSLHLGNYLGAIRQFVSLQSEKDTECLYCVVDLHAITVKQDPKALCDNTRKIAAAYIAAGVDPKRSRIFVQSSVPQHAELNWYLQCVARVGWLDRMTQFREKTGTAPPPGIRNAISRLEYKIRNDDDVDRVSFGRDDLEQIEILLELAKLRESNHEKASVGLYTYPVLQAADILAYKTTHVPVGEDQLQHLNLAGDIAAKFNKEYRDIFPKPLPILAKEGARIMSLKDGTRKMSKSDPDDNTRINLDDDTDMIARKIKKATAQTEPLPDSTEHLTNPHLKNLIGIYGSLADLTAQDVLDRYAGQGCGYFKGVLTERLLGHLGPIRDEMTKLLSDPLELDAILCSGGRQVEGIATKTLKEVRSAIGFWDPLGFH